MTAAATGSAPIAHVPIRVRELGEFCRRYQVRELALFGSVLRDDFRADSDVDVLVTFDAEARPTLFTLGEMESELELLFGRPVDLLERRGMEQCENPHVRETVMRSARVVYAR